MRRQQVHGIIFYQTYNEKEYPVAPDLAVIKGAPFHHMRSWAIGRGEQVPQVVFEVLSEETWKKDLREKPAKYARLGVQEYFAYDPHEPPLRRLPKNCAPWESILTNFNDFPISI